MSSSPFSPGSVIGRAFRVVRPLAAGGMGAVYVAEEISTGRACAVKVMHARLVEDPKNRARFAQEAAVSEHIGTEHVVETWARGVDDVTGMPFIAMELLDGETLAARIWRGGRSNVLPIAETRAVLDQLATVLEAAHARGLVHRDLKPENIFLTRAPHGDAPFTLKLLDFGVARFVDLARPVHNATAAIGTPLWMAPEQHTGAEISPAADVWAVGLIAFQLLTGRFYWLAANQKDLSIPMLLQELLFDPLPPASQRAAALGCGPVIPQGFDAWFVRCVAREPQARFPTAVEMRVLLRGALSGEPSLGPMPRHSAAPSVPAMATAFAEQPTVVHQPVAPPRPSLPAPVRAPPQRASVARQGQRPTWLVPSLIIAGVLVAAGTLIAFGYARGALRDHVIPGWEDDRPPRRGPLPQPPALPTLPQPSMSPIPVQPFPTGVFPEDVEQTWQGSREGDEPDGGGRVAFELALRRDGPTVHGEIHWNFDDGGLRGEQLSGTWDPLKGEMSLSGAGRGAHAFFFRISPTGALSGEAREGTPPRVSRMSGALKTPLVAAPRP